MGLQYKHQLGSVLKLFNLSQLEQNLFFTQSKALFLEGFFLCIKISVQNRLHYILTDLYLIIITVSVIFYYSRHFDFRNSSSALNFAK